jgi:hypothetical protein
MSRKLLRIGNAFVYKQLDASGVRKGPNRTNHCSASIGGMNKGKLPMFAGGSAVRKFDERDI